MRQNAALLPTRSVISVYGPEAEKFLSGLITNTLNKPPEATFSGLLTPQGKILFDFIVKPEGSGYLIDLPSDLTPDFLKRLMLYKLRADVTIEDKTDAYKVLAIWGAGACPENAFTDPRHKDLGFRAIVSTSDYEAFINGFNLLTEADYTAHRILVTIPEGGQDYLYSDAFPHDACYDYINGVDFKKGCFVGQEVVSRMKHRGTARKRMVQVISTETLPETGTDIISDGQALGRLGSVHDKNAIALVRLDRVAKAIENNLPITISDNPVTLEIPAWADYKFEGR